MAKTMMSVFETRFKHVYGRGRGAGGGEELKNDAQRFLSNGAARALMGEDVCGYIHALR